MNATFRILAESSQPVCLVGETRSDRWDAIGRVHEAWLGKKPDPAAPHPDLSLLVPTSHDPAAAEFGGAGGSIGIDALRGFVDRLVLTPYAAALRVGVIEPASALTLEAQNALLRYIEEPTPSSRILLSTRRAEELLPTLLSRCRIVRIPWRRSHSDLAGDLSKSAGVRKAVLEELFEIMDNSESVERLAEFGLTQPAKELYDSVYGRKIPEPGIPAAFMAKNLPVSETTLLFSEIVFSAVCARIRDEDDFSADLRLGRRMLATQADLRYHPPRAVVLAAMAEWLETGGSS